MKVQCSHLKTLNRKEIESLKDVKKGWIKERGQARSDKALILGEEFNTTKALSSSFALAITDSALEKKPKTPYELERHWKKQISLIDKQR